MAPFRSNAWIAYAFALAGVIVATVIRWLLHPILDDDYISFGFYYLAVTVAAWTGGLRPALFAAVIGAMLANYFFTPTLAIDSVQELLNMVLFGVVSVVIGVLSEISLRSLARAREAEEQKDQFLATLAHELRSPLSVIQYANQLDRLTGSCGGDRSAIIDRQIEHLSHLVNDLLDISRVARGKIHLDRQKVDAADVLHGALEKVRPMMEARQHVVHLHAPPVPLTLFGDRLRLEQVFANLLTNAAKFSLDRGEIEVAVVERPGRALIRVSDHGVGIPKEMLHRVFDLFVQVEPTRSSRDLGLGIGLSLVRRLVEMHGGSVSAHSDGPGKGSEFLVELPLATQRPTASVAGGEWIEAKTVGT